jgi:uncharacterized protein (TIGR01777 family)
MPEFARDSRIDAPAAEVFAWHGRSGAFERLVPPWERIRVLERAGGNADGARLVMEIRKGPARFRWEAIHRDHQEGLQFVDEQVRGPFAEWVHTHRFLPDGTDASTLSDHLTYRLPFGALGGLAGGAMVRDTLDRLFTHRHATTRNDLARHRRFQSWGPQRIAITGASGLIGRSLAAFLTAGGHRVDALVRRAPRPGSTEIRWDPAAGVLDGGALEGVDVVIHLGAESIAGKRWTPAQKDALLRDRARSTDLLSRTLAGLKHPPRAFLSASAVGYYGDRGDETLTEASASGVGELPEICRAWEAATEPARQAGIRVANLRFGVVLAAGGGALAKLLPPFRLGAGGPFGSGRQWMSWIALDDVVGAVHHLLFSELEGPANLVSPQPVTNLELARTLGRVLKRPALLPAPTPALRLMLGREMADELLLGGARVLPCRLESDGFPFLHPDLEGALRSELGLCKPTKETLHRT